MDSNHMERIAKNIGASLEDLMAEYATIKAEQHSMFVNAGRTEEQADMACARVAATTLKKRADALKRSGCTQYEGVFVSVPRAKDFAKMSYTKNAGILNGLDASSRSNLAGQGVVMLFVPDGDGYIRMMNESLDNGLPFSGSNVKATRVQSLPKHTMRLNDGTYFSLVWDKSSPTWPSGDANFRYAKPRPVEEPERKSMFLGRKVGDDVPPSLMAFRASGTMSRVSWPTYTPCVIAAKSSRDGKTLYAKDGVTEFTENEASSSMFPGPPQSWDYTGLGIVTLDGLDYIEEHLGTLSDKEKWDALVGLQLEVLHMDPQDNGGLVITLGDLDYTSLAMPVDLWVPKSQSDVDFGMGSRLLVIGSPWMGKEGDARLSITGWSLIEGINPSAVLDDDAGAPEAEGGWDA
mgnify:CR=1 FL=1